MKTIYFQFTVELRSIVDISREIELVLDREWFKIGGKVLNGVPNSNFETTQAAKSSVMSRWQQWWLQSFRGWGCLRSSLEMR